MFVNIVPSRISIETAHVARPQLALLEHVFVCLCFDCFLWHLIPFRLIICFGLGSALRHRCCLWGWGSNRDVHGHRLQSGELAECV